MLLTPTFFFADPLELLVGATITLLIFTSCKNINYRCVNLFSNHFTSLERVNNTEESYASVLENFVPLIEKSIFIVNLYESLQNSPRIAWFFRSWFDHCSKWTSYSESAHKNAPHGPFLVPKYFLPKTSRGPPQLFSSRFFPVVPHESLWLENRLGISNTFSNAVSCADSEYDVHFEQWSNHDRKKQAIRGEFWRLS